MKSKTLWLTSGVPGSGKSTWVKNNFNDKPYVSRDEIRFNLLKEGDDYFTHEDEVFQTFIEQIQECLDTENMCVADATHLSPAARTKVLNRLNLEDTDIVILNFEVPLSTVLTRNKKRSSLAKVPDSVVRRMFYQFTPATKNEKYKYADIITIKE